MKGDFYKTDSTGEMSLVSKGDSTELWDFVWSNGNFLVSTIYQLNYIEGNKKIPLQLSGYFVGFRNIEARGGDTLIGVGRKVIAYYVNRRSDRVCYTDRKIQCFFLEVTCSI